MANGRAFGLSFLRQIVDPTPSARILLFRLRRRVLYMEYTMRFHWVFATALMIPSVSVVACGTSRPPLSDGDDGGGSGGTTSGSGSNAPGFSSSGSTGTFASVDGGVVTIPLQGNCKGGHYTGTFAGLYTSVLTAVGVPIPVAGNVSLDLDQEGSADTTCHPAGEIPVPCNQVYTLKNGTITGTADGLFPYFCAMTGTLDCQSKVLDEGWIQCTYCAGLIAGGDGGTPAYCIGGSADGGAGIGGRFAGPLTAEYDVSSYSFVNGQWNGAEALAGNNGMMPGPDGGSIWNYISDSGLYIGPGDFGGSGTWNATWDVDQ